MIKGRQISQREKQRIKYIEGVNNKKETIAKREKQKQRNQDDRSKRRSMREKNREISMYQQRGRHEKEGDMKVNKISFWHLITWLVEQFSFPSMPKREIVEL